MTTLSEFLAGSAIIFPAPTAVERSSSVWWWINRKPTSIVLLRNGSPLAAQTVRIENAQPSETGTNGGLSSTRGVMIFGIQGHATIADTNIVRGDQFKWNAAGALANYEVIAVDKAQIGQVQIYATELS